jgi:hypothetical protein
MTFYDASEHVKTCAASVRDINPFCSSERFHEKMYKIMGLQSTPPAIIICFEHVLHILGRPTHSVFLKTFKIPNKRYLTYLLFSKGPGASMENPGPT